MCDELKKLVWLFWKLSLIGTFLAILTIRPIYSELLTIIFLFSTISLNIFAYLAFVGIGFAIITFGLLFLFVIIMVTISRPISKIGTYHQPGNPHRGWKEPLTSNLLIILKNNLIFSLPLYFSIMYFINPSNYLNPISTSIIPAEVNNTFIITLATIPGYLLSIRLLAHPIRVECSIPSLGSILKSIQNQYSETTSREILKERFMSFYFALSASAFFAMTLLYLYRLQPLKLGFSDGLIYIFNSLTMTFVPIFDPNITTNTIRIFLYLGGFCFALFLTTAFGEIILHEYQRFNE